MFNYRESQSVIYQGLPYMIFGFGALRDGRVAASLFRDPGPIVGAALVAYNDHVQSEDYNEQLVWAALSDLTRTGNACWN